MHFRPVVWDGRFGARMSRATGRTSVTIRQHEADQMDDGLRIQQVSDLLGIPGPTLRSWERRYGFPVISRSAGGHRRYSAQAVTHLRLMRDEIARGRGAADAARAVCVMLDLDNPDRARISQILSAAQEMDSDSVRKVLEQSRNELGLAATLDHVLMPTMRQVGSWWETGRCDVAQEQFVTHTVRQWLARLEALAAPVCHGPPVLLACGPQDLHTVGLEALAALLTEQQYGSRVMRASTTERKLLETVSAVDAAAVVLVSHLPTQRRSAIDELRSVSRTGCPVFYAGNAFAFPVSRHNVPGTYLGENLTIAAAMIITSLSAGAPSPDQPHDVIPVPLAS